MSFEIRNPSPALAFRSNPGRRSRTNGIVIHHTGGGANLFPLSIQEVHRWHLERGWAGFGYHFYVCLKGLIMGGRPIEWIGAHTNPPVGINSTTIGICFEGNYETVHREMPDAQFNAGVWLLRHLGGIYGNPTVQGHGDLSPTACPGRHFPLAEMRRLQIRGEEAERLTEAQVRAIIERMIKDALGGYDTEPSRWAQGEYAEAIHAGITDGTRPQGRVTREEAAIMVLRALKTTVE